jgi:taurine dioxygenase
MTAVATEERPVISPVATALGAEVSGVDIRADLSAVQIDVLRQALLRWKVLFFHAPGMTADEHLRFAARFGEVLTAHPVLGPGLAEHPGLLEISSVVGGGRSAVEPRWHADITFSVDPPMASVLRAVHVPEFGGDTMWSNAALAYRQLSEPIRALVDGLHAVHRNLLNIDRAGRGMDPGLRARFGSVKPLAVVHPVVRVHPETGERCLFVNPQYTSHIVELNNRESAPVLEMLYEHLARNEFCVRLRWEPGRIAMWDNRATVHHAPADLLSLPADLHPDPTFRRVMQRVVLAGDRPRGIDGAESEELDGYDFA